MDKIASLQELIDQSQNIVFFGGAGVSTESNIPDFRSSDGIYSVELGRHFTAEQLVNYLYDLEAKLRNEQLIDFIRAVSPAIYRIFMRLIRKQIPDIDSYIHN